MAFSITVTGNGTYNTYDVDPPHVIRGGYNIIKVDSSIGGATITPEVDFGADTLWAPLLAVDGSTVRTITASGTINLQPLKVGMRLRFIVTGYTTQFTIKGL